MMDKTNFWHLEVHPLAEEAGRQTGYLNSM